MADTISLDGEVPAAEERTPRKPLPGADAPAAETPPPTPKAKPAAGRSAADKKLAASIAQMYVALGFVGMGIGDARADAGLKGTAEAVAIRSDELAEAWMDLADKNPRVKDTLKKLTEASAVGVLVSLHMACAMPFLVDRQIVPGFLAGEPPSQEAPAA